MLLRTQDEAGCPIPASALRSGAGGSICSGVFRPQYRRRTPPLPAHGSRAVSEQDAPEGGAKGNAWIYLPCDGTVGGDPFAPTSDASRVPFGVCGGHRRTSLTNFILVILVMMTKIFGISEKICFYD